MKLAAFLGSPRAGGNTDTLAECVVKGAQEAGIEAVTVALRRLAIRPCTGCEQCWSGAKPCVLADDMGSLYDLIAESEVLLLATPVYWYAPTATMKLFIDRLVPFNRPQGRSMIEGKSLILAVTYEEEGPEAVDPLLSMIDLSARYLGLNVVGRVIVDGCGPKGATMDKPEALKQAYEIGRGLQVGVV